VRRLSGDSPHTAELCDEKTRLFGDICQGFSADLRRLLVAVFEQAGAAEPTEAADIALALAAGLQAVPDGERLLDLACTALLAGLPTAPAGAR
jgi:AcrR family transcriptional regulator